MLEPLSIAVLRLVRVAIGPLALGDLQKGATRMLTSEEKRALDRTMR
jgi:23S rRNA pseudouridine2605 synthase